MYVIIRSLSRYVMNPIPFRVFLVSLSLTHSQNMDSNGVPQLRMFPSKPNIGRKYTSPGLKGLISPVIYTTEFTLSINRVLNQLTD